MAFGSLSQLLLVGILIAAFTLEAQGARASRKNPTRGQRPARPARKNSKKTDYKNFGCATDTDVTKNIKDLWGHVKFLSQPVEVHVHNDDPQQCDDYFGCDYGHHNHQHSRGSNHSGHAHGSHGHGHGSHGHHGHGSHGHGSHGHGSHGHGHGHGSHGKGSHGMPEPAYKDNHIHIHLSVNNKEDCNVVSYRPRDEFVYARCDMAGADQSSTVTGSIVMRQKPHGTLESKLRLRGFSGPSEGIRAGAHDYFFDVHPFADFSDGCNSFGTHQHIHHHEGAFDHEHNHSHEDDAHHNHDHHDGHSHSVHDHHAHEDDWGNVVINRRGISNMDVNCTHHELYGPESMLGHGIVLHDREDNPVACCAIVYANVTVAAWDSL